MLFRIYNWYYGTVLSFTRWKGYVTLISQSFATAYLKTSVSEIRLIRRYTHYDRYFLDCHSSSFFAVSNCSCRVQARELLAICILLFSKLHCWSCSNRRSLSILSATALHDLVSTCLGVCYLVHSIASLAC